MDANTDNGEMQPRTYQVSLEQSAMKENTIIFLPTGSGKTFIAVQVIKRMQKDIQGTFSSGAKRSMFLVNSVVLVQQQMEVLRELLQLQVKGYSSENKVDLWKKEDWLNELEETQVLVMSAQILLDMLLHNYISLSRINLIIFDECHHAVDQHPMRRIMCCFRNISQQAAPRVIGLTATLLNKNIKSTQVKGALRELEKTFNAKISTSDSEDQVRQFSTDPYEYILFYVNHQLETVQNMAITVLNQLQDIVQLMPVEEQKTNSSVPNAVKMTPSSDKLRKMIKNSVESIKKHFENFGMYGASLSILAYIVLFERVKLAADNQSKQRILQVAITYLNKARTLLERHMQPNNGTDRILMHCSPKIKQLLQLLMEFSPDAVASDKTLSANKYREKLNGLIFVKERFTSKVLCMLLCHAAKFTPELSYLKVDFVVGFNVNPFSDTREDLYNKKQNKLVVEKFRTQQLNLVVSTETMEEGIDIPCCTLVVRFDEILNYRSYVQSKGRGRSKTAVYAMMVDQSIASKFCSNLTEYKAIENLLTQELVGKSEDRLCPSEIEMADKYKALCPPYIVNNAIITIESAISLLNRYCQTLPQDKFTLLQLEWFQHIEVDSKLVSVLLPTVCPLRDPIKGIPTQTLMYAKKSAALEACIKLHQIGELNDYLLPVDRAEQVFNEETEKMFFSHWITEVEEMMDNDGEMVKRPKAGSKSRKRIYQKELPKCLRGIPVYGSVNYYVHTLELRPVQTEEANEESLQRIHSLLAAARGFAILTRHPLPSLCTFSLYMSSGEVVVHFTSNVTTVQVNPQQIEEIKRFHYLVFADVLGLQKSFMLFDVSHGDNHYFMVPTVEGSDIDWKTMAEHHSIEALVEPSIDQRKSTPANSDNFDCAVVTPWYRGDRDSTRYLVTKICDSITPNSPFCDAGFDSYAHYYQVKYQGLSVMGSQDQKMLQVRHLSNRLNGMLPRSITLTSSGLNSNRYKKNIDDRQANHIEYLVPEFCVKFNFPGILWLKATLMPSALHRITMLLQAEELRQLIAQETQLGVVNLPQGARWKPLIVDLHALSKTQKAEVLGEDKAKNKQPVAAAEDVTESTLPIQRRQEDNYKLALKKLEEEFPWTAELEPIDIERNFDTVSVMDIECYENFLIQKLPISPVKSTLLGISSETRADKIKSFRALCAPPQQKCETIEILRLAPSELGPEQTAILEVLTTSKSNDIINMERLETLGDSFLKFSISLILFHRFPQYDEGRLSELKGKIISNRNLLYCGMMKNLPGRIKVERFAAKDWIIPAFSVPRPLQEAFIEQGVCVSVLFALSLSRQEMLSGGMSDETEQNVGDSLSDWLEQNTRPMAGMEMFLGRQEVQDKVAADCVEALIGAYLKNGGLEAGFRLLQWLEIVPREENPHTIMMNKVSTPLSEGKKTEEDIAFLLDHTGPQIESIIGYKFKDPSFLLQAMSHASNSRNRITDSYQRLEFLGDAVLDFLVTCYIYEQCGRLDPGQLTDLRSALVNNNTLAGLVVRLGLHKFMLTANTNLDAVIVKFVQLQTQRNHVIDEAVLYLLEEEDCHLAEYIEVPKALGDLLEALIGAIFLDSSGDMATVWRVIYGIMHQEIALFSQEVPKNPVRMLYEEIHATPLFLSTQIIDRSVMVPLQVRVDGKITLVHGFGKNKSCAKRSAAKIALRMLQVTS